MPAGKHGDEAAQTPRRTPKKTCMICMQCAITWVECLGATTLRTARTLSMASGTCLMTPMLKRPRIVKLSLREPICSSTPAEMLVPLLRQNPRWVLTTGLGECPGFRTSPLQAQKSLKSLAETNQVRVFCCSCCLYLLVYGCLSFKSSYLFTSCYLVFITTNSSTSVCLQ